MLHILGGFDFQFLVLQDEQDGRHSESRSRVVKVLKEQLPTALTVQFSFTSPQHSNKQEDNNHSGASAIGPAMSDVRAVLHSLGDSDHEGVIDFLRLPLQLVPQRRLLPVTLLQLALFRRPLAQANAVDYKQQFHSTHYEVPGGIVVAATELTPKVRRIVHTFFLTPNSNVVACFA